MISPASPVSPPDGWQEYTDKDTGKVFYFHPVTRQTTWSDPRSPPSPPARDMDQSRRSEGEQLASPSPLFSPASSQGSCGWEQLVDEVSGRFYYYNPTSGATSWTAPEPQSPSSPSSPRGGPPPLPAEDYPVDVPNDHSDAVFTVNPQSHVSLIPRAHLDLRDGNSSQWRLQEGSQLTQRLMGNGVSEEGTALQVKNWRHSVAEDTFVPSHRRNISDFTEIANRRHSPDSLQLSDRHRLKRNLSDRSTGSQELSCHLLEKAGILNKTKVVDNGKKIRKNWSQSWTVLHGGILTFHKDPKSAPTGNANKSSQIVPEYTVELRGALIGRASKEKSSKKNVLELKTRQGCEYLIQYDTESIISDWLKVIQESVRQLDLVYLSEDEDEVDNASDKEDKDRKRTSARVSSGTADTEQRHVRTKLRRFLQRRPTLQSVKEKGYIRDNVFGCHLDTLCHRENTTIPRFVEKCIKAVERRGLDVDGIYRVSGNLAVIQRLRHKADHEEQLDLEDGQWEEIHVITGALKLFLRELPEPLFPFSCFEKFIAAIQVPDYNLRVSYMKDLVRSLPLPNNDTMELLFKHLLRVIEHKESNRMSFQSVAIVFGPTLLADANRHGQSQI
uniref:Rho GTPase activating protein 27, like n=1 Tax=Labrus bergylta TaxID=56723 RepID=A0A3Q3GTP7_9LABR